MSEERRVNATGRCACGHVRYAMKAAPLIVHGCHCGHCQRQTGAPYAINALVTVEAGGRTFHRELQPSSGYLGSNDPRLHLGLGSASKIERLVVRWPDGSRQGWQDLAVKARLSLRQRSGE